MFKLLAVVSLCVALAASQSCSGTAALRTLYGFGNTINTAAVQSSVNYCSSIKTSAVCCTATDMNSLQTKSDTLIANLTSNVAARDKYFVASRNNVLADLQTSFISLSAAMVGFTQTMVLISVQPATTQAELANFDIIFSLLESVSDAATNLTSAFAGLTQDYTGMQTARATCITQVVKLQNAAWCLSCNPEAANNGYNAASNSISISDDVCTRIKNACFNFINLAQYQNGVFAIRSVIDVINQQTALISSINTGAGLDPTKFDITSTVPASADLPAGCTSAANCDFICDSIFNGGLVNQDALAFGGDASGDGGRRLAQRMLAGTYNPDENEAGTSVEFSQDPGNTQKFACLSLGSVFAGVMMMISCIFLF